MDDLRDRILKEMLIDGKEKWAIEEAGAKGEDFVEISDAHKQIRANGIAALSIYETGRINPVVEKVILIAILYDYYATSVQNTFIVTLNNAAVERFPDLFHQRYAPLVEIYEQEQFREKILKNKVALDTELLKKGYAVLKF